MYIRGSGASSGRRAAAGGRAVRHFGTKWDTVTRSGKTVILVMSFS